MIEMEIEQEIIDAFRLDLQNRIDQKFEDDNVGDARKVWLHHMIDQANYKELVVLVSVFGEWCFGHMQKEGLIVPVKMPIVRKRK